MSRKDLIRASTLLDCAVEAATTAGKHALKNWKRRADTVCVTAHDIKLRLDIECQEITNRIIRRAFPSHGFLGEEKAGPQTDRCDSVYQWIVDPIDGTVNFSHGFPFWCCSIAVRAGEEVVAGAVFAPELNELYTATSDTRSKLNGKPISSSNVRKNGGAIIHTGLPLLKNNRPSNDILKLAEAFQRVRISGSAALDICHVARGSADAYYESFIYLWDISAGDLIVRKAGGRTEMIKHPDKNHSLAFLACNRFLLPQIKSVLSLK